MAIFPKTCSLATRGVHFGLSRTLSFGDPRYELTNLRFETDGALDHALHI